MKKTLKAAVALSVLTAPAYAANLENPLYMPKQGAVYSKTSAGVMYKVADDTNAMQLIGICCRLISPGIAAHTADRKGIFISM